MSLNLDRRDFLKGSAAVAGGLGLASCGLLGGPSTSPTFNMCGFAAPKLDKVRVGIIGLGMRGSGSVSRLAKIKDVEIVAICDLVESKVKRAQKTLMRNGRRPAKEFYGSTEIWKEACQLDLDLLYIVTPWEWHTPMSVYAMEHGMHAACEVPVCLSEEEAWQLVETSERTRKHAIILENCCYDFFEMQTLNMVRQGVFGELTHAEGAYIHPLSELIANGYEGHWRYKHNAKKNGNLYPTHGLGPIAQCMDVNRGNKMDYITSMSSQEAAFTYWASKHNRPDLAKKEGYRGDMNTSLVKLAKGQTIMIQHDVSTPRPYSRIHLLQGTRGCARKWPFPQKIALDTYHNGHRWLNSEKMKEVAAKYQHPLHKTIGNIARKVGGHGGMDFVMDYRLIYCLKNGLPVDMDCYDAAAWSVITPLSIKSTAANGESLKVPDFTRGNWKTNKSLGIVDVDATKLPLFDIRKDGAKQLNLH